jgi:ribosomal protein S18 acetylase RimI-like enzyme
MTTIRPMTPADVEPAVAAILADDWGDRREWFRFAVDHPGCHVVVAHDAEAGIVGTGVATVNGAVGWIGTIWVASGFRGRGLGRALTEAPIALAEDAGCRTLVLVATELGRPLYERLGFEIRTWYRTLEAPGLQGVSSPSAAPARLQGFRPEDLDAVAALDRSATGEDRGHLFAALATPDGSRILPGDDGRPAGFIVRAPWGGGATVVPDLGDAMALLEERRHGYPPDRRVRCGILLENEAGAAALERAGWTEAWRAPRLVRGDPLAWHPEHIWGQFNHALG